VTLASSTGWVMLRGTAGIAENYSCPLVTANAADTEQYRQPHSNQVLGVLLESL
jgi:hypothetical protein